MIRASGLRRGWSHTRAGSRGTDVRGMRWGGGGERGPSPPRPRARPGCPSRRRGQTGRVGTILCAVLPSRWPARAIPRRATGQPRYLYPRAAGLHPSHLALRQRQLEAGGTSPPPPPTPLPSPSPLTPTSSAASLAGRSESKREQTLGSFGEGGTGLKGTTTFFKPGKKWRGCQEGARPRVAPRLSGGNNVQKQWEYRRASAFRLRVLFLEAPPTP